MRILIAAKQNQKFPFHFFRFAAEGWGGETRGKCKEIFWFLHTRVRERVRGALVRISAQSERTRQFQATTRSARAISRNQDSIQNTFELRSIHTAKKFRIGFDFFYYNQQKQRFYDKMVLLWDQALLPYPISPRSSLS